MTLQFYNPTKHSPTKLRKNLKDKNIFKNKESKPYKRIQTLQKKGKVGV